MFVELILL